MHKHKWLYAQRKHVIQSLDILLYQLHVLAFFISPSAWALFFRLLTQSQCKRELDTPWSLRAFFALLISVNILTVWSHATSGASGGKTVILDFIGMAHPPSKFRLLSLDFFIVFLQMLLATIAHETSLAKDGDRDIDSATSTPLAVVARLRNPSPPQPSASALRNLDGLPLPTTAPWPTVGNVGWRMLLGIPPGRPREVNNETGNAEEANRIPGALDG
ncbi:hypothetical protein K438DRAFT_151957 [Mycena galopus ATCC 62051]|nr:hypothetical protein K438DRAFT_151957 [Mycena galopus ATCC 62051]